MRCAITGASGFVGRALVPALVQGGHTVERWGRGSDADKPFDLEQPGSGWEQQLAGVEVVVHLAALVHQRGENSTAAHARYRRLNTEATLRLARAAADAGVKKFLFLSTAKVFGEGEDGPYAATARANPQDAYAISKWEAEQQLLELHRSGALRVVIIRPPLVYGPGVGGNFRRLVQLAKQPLPLPFAAVRNRRDMIGLDNLIDLLQICIDNPAADGGTWTCSDGAPYSLAELLTAIRAVQGRGPGLFEAPAVLLGPLQSLLGKEVWMRLCGDFEVNIDTTCRALSWHPRMTLADTLRAMQCGIAP